MAKDNMYVTNVGKALILLIDFVDSQRTTPQIEDEWRFSLQQSPWKCDICLKEFVSKVFLKFFDFILQVKAYRQESNKLEFRTMYKQYEKTFLISKVKCDLCERAFSVLEINLCCHQKLSGSGAFVLFKQLKWNGVWKPFYESINSLEIRVLCWEEEMWSIANQTPGLWEGNIFKLDCDLATWIYFITLQ